jgi:hypothetical protein
MDFFDHWHSEMADENEYLAARARTEGCVDATDQMQASRPVILDIL